MKVIVCKDYEEMSLRSARIVAAQITVKPNCLLGFATGSTPVGMYHKLAEMNQALQLHKRGTGIAVSIPISGVQGWLYKLLNAAESQQTEHALEKEEKKMSESITHAMIVVTASQGYSDNIMCTARAAGATGGTILKGLRCSPAEIATHFGLPIQDEQEIVAIVVPQAKKTEVMTAISSQHGINTPAHAVAFSLPVDAIMGLG